MAVNGFGCVMSALSRLDQALRYLWPFNDPYEDGVKRAAPDNRVVFIDPEQLKDSDKAKNISKFREMYARQGIKLLVDDQIVEELIDVAIQKGPHVRNGSLEDGTYAGLVNKPDADFGDIRSAVSRIAGIPWENLRRIPGDNYIWQKFIGIHEGMHTHHDLVTPPFDTDEKRRRALSYEIEGDKAGIKYLRELGREDMVQAWKDYRALGAALYPYHATAIFLRSDEPAIVTDAHVYAASNFKHEMDMAVKKELGRSLGEINDLFKDNPEQYIDTVDRLLACGEIDSTPEVKAYIKDFADAYRRQVLEAHLDPAVPRGGNDKKETPQVEKPAESSRHVHTHHSDAGSYTVIEDGPASGYFNAKAAGPPEGAPAPEAGHAPAAKAALLPT